MAKTQLTTNDIADLTITDSDVAAANKDGVQSKASMRTISASTPAADGVDSGATAGTGVTVSASDHKHQFATYSSTPAATDATAASAGTSGTAPSRGDHRHLGHAQSHNHSAAGDGNSLSPTTLILPTGGGKIASGNSMPGSPSTNDMVFRTDWGEWFYYNGTRWLTVVQRCLPMTNIAGAMPFTTSPIDALYAVSPANAGSIDIWMEAISIAAMVQTTNNGSNYWSMAFRKVPSYTVLVTPTTAALTAGVFASNPQVTAIGAALGTTSSAFSLNCSKTGTPGGLYVVASLLYRVIGS